MKKAEQEAASKGQEIDPKLVLEVKQMEKEMRRTGNSFLSGKSRLKSRKSGQESDDSSDEEAKSKASKSRVSLMDQQANKSHGISKSGFAAGVSDDASEDDAAVLSQPLDDRTKVDGVPWQLLKKEAMQEKFKISVTYQKLRPADRKLISRLIEAQAE